MGTKFKDFIREIEVEAQVEGPVAVAQLEAFQEYFKMKTDDRYPWEDEDGNEIGTGAWSNPPDLCRACGGMLLPENRRVADGCPCNSARGVNHGLVPKNTCTCLICDPAQTGSTRIGNMQE